MSLEYPLESSPDARDEVPDLPPGVSVDVPYHLDVLPDGSETVVIGDVETLKEYCHQQGDNPFGFHGTCGLCSCEGVLREFGREATEAAVVKYAIENWLCNVEGAPHLLGGTSEMSQARILSDLGVPAHYERARSLEDLAAAREQGHGVIVELDCAALWDNADYYDGWANHAVTVIGVARDPGTWQIRGFYVNDTGTGEAGRFVDVDTMDKAWAQMGASTS